MKSSPVLLSFVVCSILSTAGAAQGKAQRAQAPSPEPVFKEIVSYDRRGGEQEIFGFKRSAAMDRLLSENLVLSWTRAASTKGNFFDADVFTGRQSVTAPSRYEAVRTIRNDGRRAVVEAIVTVTVDGMPVEQRQHYTFVMEGGGWKLDEINYEAGSKHGSLLHAHLRTWLGGFVGDHMKTAPSARQPGGDDVAAIAKRGVARANGVYAESGMAGLKENQAACGKTSSGAGSRSQVSDCLAFTWAALRLDALGSAKFGFPPLLRAREIVEPLENDYLRLGGRYQDAYEISQIVGRSDGR